MSIKQSSPETSRIYWSSEEQRGRLNLNEEEEEEEEEMEVVVSRTQEEEKETMFEKPLTPSDVGKLNRLVIPKQHAEKHFPQDSAAKGLLLSFEDESGKCWRFRYSYWNSSQSYVLTKGWSRYVKDKRLHAGDVVFFHRHRQHPQRFFISSTTRSLHPPYPTLPFPYQHPFPGGVSQPQAQNQITASSSGSRVLRLFGVNMECQPDHHNHSQNSYTTHTHHSSNPHPHMLRQQP